MRKRSRFTDDFIAHFDLSVPTADLGYQKHLSIVEQINPLVHAMDKIAFLLVSLNWDDDSQHKTARYHLSWDWVLLKRPILFHCVGPLLPPASFLFLHARVLTAWAGAVWCWVYGWRIRENLHDTMFYHLTLTQVAVSHRLLFLLHRRKNWSDVCAHVIKLNFVCLVLIS